jgi:adenylylsulfate kinase-like enzyme
VTSDRADDPLAGPRTRLVLICGLPASGKSTLARHLATKIPAIRLNKDGWVTQLGGDLWDDEFRVRLEHQLWVLSQDLLARGQRSGATGRELSGMRNDSGRELWGWESSCIISMRPWRS